MSRNTPGGIVDEVATALRDHVVPGRGEKEKAYLKSDLRHLGVPVPAVRKVARQVVRGSDPDEVRRLANTLFEEPVHELRLAAVEALSVVGRSLDPGDLPRLEAMVRAARTWALVDPIAIDLVGGMVERDPDAADALDRFVEDEDVWIRRTALLALLRPLRKGDGDFDRFRRYADRLLDEREFFIRKAIGWVLRETGKSRPDLVQAFLRPRLQRVSGVTLREALKPLSEDVRRALLSARGTPSASSRARRTGKSS